MSTYKLLVDADHLSMKEIKTLWRNRFSTSGDEFRKWNKATDHVFLIGSKKPQPKDHTFEIGEDDQGGYHPFRDLYDQVSQTLFVSCQGERNAILIRAFQITKLPLEDIPEWQTKWQHPAKDDFIKLIEWLEKHDNHWIYTWS